MDIIGALIGIVLFAVPMAGIAAAVRASLGRPIIFRQRRPGRGGKAFTLYKFRTMIAGDESSTGPEHDAQRMTRLGSILRQTSLDELPELFNVLRGDMSLVGPRPLLSEYLPRYSSEQARRHIVRPGLTGWAQVNGRNAIKWEEKLGLDVWYVDHWSIGLDLKILFMTLSRVGGRRDINSSGHATMPEFLGRNPPTKGRVNREDSA